MRLLVTGGRTYHNRLAVWSALDRIHAVTAITLLIEGGAAGADRLARQWAAKENVPVDAYPADWKRWGLSAGPRRNADMLRAGVDVVLAFPGGAGTANMIRQAQEMGVIVWHPHPPV